MEGILLVVAIAVILILLEIREFRRDKAQKLERRALKRSVDRLLAYTAKLAADQQHAANELAHLRSVYQKSVDHFDDVRNQMSTNEAKLDAIVKELEVRREGIEQGKAQFDFVEGL